MLTLYKINTRTNRAAVHGDDVQALHGSLDRPVAVLGQHDADDYANLFTELADCIEGKPECTMTAEQATKAARKAADALRAVTR